MSNSAQLLMTNVVTNSCLGYIVKVLRPFRKVFTASWLYFHFLRTENHVQGHVEVLLKLTKGSSGSHGFSLVPAKWQGANVHAEKPFLANCYTEAAVSFYSISLHLRWFPDKKTGTMADDVCSRDGTYRAEPHSLSYFLSFFTV